MHVNKNLEIKEKNFNIFNRSGQPVSRKSQIQDLSPREFLKKQSGRLVGLTIKKPFFCFSLEKVLKNYYTFKKLCKTTMRKLGLTT